MASIHAARCRICSGHLGEKPVLSYRNMPGCAQNFPDATNLHTDHGSDLELYECPQCGLIQLACPPVPYYREVIRAAAFSPEMREFRIRQLGDWVERHELRGKRILEIGCGKGEYLSLLGETGAEATGLEYAGASVRHCQRNGLSAIRGFLAKPSQKISAPAFDGFMCLNFMEHWPAPVQTLRAIGNNLLAGAIGLVEVPNFDMILRENLYSEFISDHLSYFTGETLRFALQQAGFEVLECRSIWYDYILSATVRKRQPSDLSALLGQQHKITDEITGFITRFPIKSVAVWGAGHQALATLALAGLGSSIRYVIDSAPFKQGKFTPATHLPIVPPSQLSDDPVQAIIIMAAGYSDEIAGIIRQHYRLGIPVAILRADELETV
jgi:SAM-dependent methyltransferase